jgi:hypothetical protein
MRAASPWPQPYYNLERPDFAPEWSLRFALTFLFPT